MNKNLTAIFGTDPRAADLQQAAEKYLASIGLTAEEIAGLKKPDMTGARRRFGVYPETKKFRFFLKDVLHCIYMQKTEYLLFNARGKINEI